ncbi:hypothetical protein M569_01882 [Genlisea aurea]|uniref:Auxin-responsive protein n=1 Tax=Genlisea aurea TaxID=192259 RepID=S8D664_9LAMI|nr:hypothetical protein M569_01882 [Genlisea aurea]
MMCDVDGLRIRQVFPEGGGGGNMPPSPESESDDSASLKTELTLGLPGTVTAAEARKIGAKRDYAQDLRLGSDSDDLNADSPPKKAQVVGWPPVRSFRKNAVKYVKVAVDGAPYLRKVDLQLYTGYQHLLAALEQMFSCLTICNVVNEKKSIWGCSDHVPTYEDGDGDWMLLGDVPWKMFLDSCKRMRLMKSSEAVGLGGKLRDCSQILSC